MFAFFNRYFIVLRHLHLATLLPGRRPTSRRQRDAVMWAQRCSDNDAMPQRGKVWPTDATAKGCKRSQGKLHCNVNITWLNFGGLSNRSNYMIFQYVSSLRDYKAVYASSGWIAGACHVIPTVATWLSQLHGVSSRQLSTKMSGALVANVLICLQGGH